MITIGIDCRLAGAAHAGIGRYIAELVRRLVELDADLTWVCFFNAPAQPREIWPGGVPKQVKVVMAGIPHYSWREQLSWPWLLSRYRLDLLHVPHFNVPILYRGKMVVTIHDLLWHEYRGPAVTTLPAMWYWLKYGAYRLVAAQAIRQAKRILVPAETIKRTIIRYHPSAAPKITVTKEGVATDFWGGVSQRSTAPAHPDKRLVYVGSLYPHKNVDLVIQALAALPDFTLTIVGARSVFQDRTKQLVAEAGVGQQVQWGGYLPDTELWQLLRRSWALVQPSLSEGFGLTGVEAMAAGVPVLASDIPIFHEIYGQAASFFDPHQPASFVAAVKSLSPARRQQLIAAGKNQVAQYSWDEMAKQTQRAYQVVLDHD